MPRIKKRKQATPRHLLAASRALRREMTPQEKRLWAYLRHRRLGGLKFRRQPVVDRFITDYFCHAAQLVVELDGSVHQTPEQQVHDAERQALLEMQGYRVLRFTNDQIDTDLDTALSIIAAWAATEQYEASRSRGESS